MCIAQMILLKFTDDVPFCILSTVCIMLIRTIKRAFLGLFILILASVSVVVAAIAGATEGHTTDIGFIRGGLLGVVAGVITAVQLFGLMLHGDQSLSKVNALMRRIMNGKAIMGLVRPAVLKAYQWQLGLRLIIRDLDSIRDPLRIRSENRISGVSGSESG
ncbi:hypothetical protein DY000_02049682 [Brassica cretica]|uniref:Uncharacterized protein n=1 Tax=Brassica cretica TaxID=69181 RepID=A0ABQ7ETV6_BRACR|nr:hypothetical protein DY000_02049682 [Brassica cretica]